MKKFLTVLLALSVVFTYTVGTAFAATPPSAAEKTAFDTLIDQAASKVKGDFNTNYSIAIENLDDTKELDTNFTTSKAIWKKAASVYKTAQETAIADRAVEMKALYKADKEQFAAGLDLSGAVALFTATSSGGSTDTSFTTDEVAAYSDTAALATAIQNDADVKLSAAKEEFSAIKASALTALNSVNISMYSKTIQEINGADTSYYDLAQNFITEQIAAVNAIVLDALDNSAAKVAAKAIADNTGIGRIGGSTGIMKNFEYDAATAYYLINAAGKVAAGVLKTIDEENASSYDLEVAKKGAMGLVNSEVSTYLALAANKTDAAAMAAAKKMTDAYIIAQTYRIENATGAPITAPQTIDTSKKTYDINVERIQELEAYAEKYKLEKDANGNLIRDAKQVDGVVKTAKDLAYGNNPDEYGTDKLSAAKAEIEKNCNAEAAKSIFAIEAKKAEIETARKAKLYNNKGEDNYYALEKAKVNAAYDAMLAKVDNAKDDTAIGKIVIANEEAATVNIIRTKVQVAALVKALPKFVTDKDNLLAYETYLNANASKPTDAGYRDFTNYKEDFFADFYAEKGVRADADITTAIFNEARAALEAVKTNAQMAVDKLAVEALIAALPEIVTVSNKDAVMAAWKAAYAYNDDFTTTDISNIAKLNSAINALFATEKVVANRLYVALPATVTVADKAAVDAYGKALQVIIDNIGGGKIYKGKNVNNEIANYKAKVASIKQLELNAVTAAINALPLNITMNEKASVEAARALYDAYVKDYTYYANTDLADIYDAKADIKNSSDLFAAEAEIAALVKAENNRIKAGVQATTIKIYSKAYKKYTKISWKKELGFKVDGYEVYRSTKKNTGFKKIWTAKSTAKSVNNTKNRISGKKYYYYVKGFRMLDGEKVYTKKSITIYRTAK